MSWILTGAMFGDRATIAFCVEITVGQYRWLTQAEWAVLADYFI